MISWNWMSLQPESTSSQFLKISTIISRIWKWRILKRVRLHFWKTEKHRYCILYFDLWDTWHWSKIDHLRPKISNSQCHYSTELFSLNSPITHERIDGFGIIWKRKIKLSCGYIISIIGIEWHCGMRCPSVWDFSSKTPNVSIHYRAILTSQTFWVKK